MPTPNASALLIAMTSRVLAHNMLVPEALSALSAKPALLASTPLCHKEVELNRPKGSQNWCGCEFTTTHRM